MKKYEIFTEPKIIEEKIQNLTSDNIKNLTKKYPLLLFKNQNLTQEDLKQNSYKFGEPFIEEFLKDLYSEDFKSNFDQYIVPLSSSGILGNEYLEWHKDNIFIKESTGRLLYSVSIPDNNSGKTCWADTIKIFKLLPDDIKNDLIDVEVMYDFNTNGKSHIKKEVWKKAVVDINGDFSLNLSAWMSHIPVIKVKNINNDYFNSIIQYIDKEFLSNKNFIYEHSWSENELIYFNNLSTIHKREKIDSTGKERLLYRLTVKI